MKSFPKIDFCLFSVYVRNGIALVFGRKTGYNIVYKEVLDRGARIIVLHENEKVFDTYVVDTLGVHLPYTHDRSE